MPPSDDAPSNIAKLVLQTGSRAGMQAQLMFGYYMIGRHKECQIRPKSRSVSRHHCLLHRGDDGLKVFDLESTSGTRINEEKAAAKTWLPLTDGDMLRCGKIVFRVSVMEAVPSNPAREVATVGASGDGDSMMSGAAWHEVDIADYLGSEDDAEREKRYESIRDQNEPADIVQDDGVFDDFEDDPAITAVDGIAPPDELARANDVASQSANFEQDNGDPAETPQKRSVPKPSKPGRLPAKFRKRAKSGGSGMSAAFSDLERLKMVGAVVLAVAMVGVLGLSAYRLYTGPDVRVLQGID